MEKPAPGTAPSNLINAGTYVLEPSVLARIPLGEKTSIERVTFPAVAADGDLYAVATDDYWLDAGRPELYLAANLDVLAGKRRHDRAVGVDPAAVVDPTAVVVDSVIAAGARVGAGAEVRESVVLAGAEIGEDAEVTASIVMGRIASRGRVHRCVLGSDGFVAAGELVADERRPAPAA